MADGVNRAPRHPNARHWRRSHGVFLMEAMWSRYLPSCEQLRDLLDQRFIGTVLMVDAGLGYQTPAGTYWGSWTSSPNLGAMSRFKLTTSGCATRYIQVWDQEPYSRWPAGCTRQRSRCVSAWQGEPSKSRVHRQPTPTWPGRLVIQSSLPLLM